MTNWQREWEDSLTDTFRLISSLTDQKGRANYRLEPLHLRAISFILPFKYIYYHVFPPITQPIKLFQPLIFIECCKNIWRVRYLSIVSSTLNTLPIKCSLPSSRCTDVNVQHFANIKFQSVATLKKWNVLPKIRVNGQRQIVNLDVLRESHAPIHVQFPTFNEISEDSAELCLCASFNLSSGWAWKATAASSRREDKASGSADLLRIPHVLRRSSRHNAREMKTERYY